MVNGVTAWRMLHRAREVTRRPDDRGPRRQRRRRLDPRPARPARRDPGDRHRLGPQHHDRLRELGVDPVDYRADDVPARVRELAPDGVAAVFDHVGGPGIADSWRMLAPGGTLVVLRHAPPPATTPGNPRLPVLKLLAKLLLWNLLPNGRHATFFNLWAGRRHLRAVPRRSCARTSTAVLDLLAAGKITAQVAKEFPLRDAAAALRYAETGGVAGKVVLIP